MAQRAKIAVLDKKVSELIAAGEVIERPSSVIKELVENAIDAGATAIVVEIRRGGISYMRVTDNGCGIPKEEVKTAFMRHATSKVRDERDLEQIATLGFRGEALASICAVGKVEILTKTANAPFGTRYVVEGDEEQYFDDTGCPNGTTLIVRELFFNTPARMKFLKKDVTEGNAVFTVVEKLALSHPEISFKFLRDGQEKLFTPGDGNLFSAIHQIYGGEFAKDLVKVDFCENGIGVHGYVSTPVQARKSRSMQNFFINCRFIKSGTCMAALEEAFRGSIMVGKFPACVLHLDISAAEVDVNVHPAKIEVRFSNERPIFNAVYQAVKFALKNDTFCKEVEFAPSHAPIAPADFQQIPAKQIAFTDIQPPVQTGSQAPLPTVKAPVLPKADSHADAADGEDAFLQSAAPARELAPTIARLAGGFADQMRPQTSKQAAIIKPEAFQTPAKKSPRPDIWVEEEKPLAAPQTAKEDSHSSQPLHYTLVGELFGTYLVVQAGENAYLIDKHAAHERLLYEQLRARGHKMQSQVLLGSVAVSVSRQEREVLLKNSERLFALGFVLEDYGPSAVAVREAPLQLDAGDIEEVVLDIAQKLLDNKSDLTPECIDDLYHSMACRAAIKANDKNARLDLENLVRMLEENPDVRYCPHGRPIYISLSKKEIMKQFGRLGTL